MKIFTFEESVLIALTLATVGGYYLLMARI